MPDFIIHGLNASAVERLRRRADVNGRSLEEEMKDILTAGVEYIERVERLTADLKPMSLPTPVVGTQPDDRLKEARAFHERIRQESKEYHRRAVTEQDES